MATTKNKQKLEQKLAELKALNDRVESFPKGGVAPPMLGVALMAAAAMHPK